MEKKNSLWLLGNTIASAALTITAIGLIAGQIWIHNKLADRETTYVEIQVAREQPTTDKQETTAAPEPDVTTVYVPSESEILLQELKQEVEYLRYEVFGCNNCTEEAVTDDNGRTKCVDKFFVDELTSCPCFCGLGYLVLQKECVWFEGNSDQDCREVRSRDPANHKCGDDVSFELQATLEQCMVDHCVITNVTQKTLDEDSAQSSSDFFYSVYTEFGAKCDIGWLDLANYPDRQRGAIDIYELNIQCDACMLSSDEVFKSLEVRIEGSNGWDVEYIDVEVNGNTGRYVTTESVDEYLTIAFSKQY